MKRGTKPVIQGNVKTFQDFILVVAAGIARSTHVDFPVALADGESGMLPLYPRQERGLPPLQVGNPLLQHGNPLLE